ncbi:Phospholipid phosphatase 4 [Takifugu flavidus]|uniref:Phospholipid phosphatase 4 n=1 Tax=Takifugu flavidus TaxID=433684 RepID=A0A5C6PF30_9TELE|nr:Phospholipid phosphatase 4 [Takifugu flavidus]
MGDIQYLTEYGISARKDFAAMTEIKVTAPLMQTFGFTEFLEPFERVIQPEELWLYKNPLVESDHIPKRVMFGDPPADGRLGKEKGEGGGQVEDRIGRRGEERRGEERRGEERRGEERRGEERRKERRRRRRGKKRGRERRGEEKEKEGERRGEEKEEEGKEERKGEERRGKGEGGGEERRGEEREERRERRGEAQSTETHIKNMIYNHFSGAGGHYAAPRAAIPVNK